AGHLIFRIKDYSKKLDEAKQYDTILHSAMFSNKAFGYALRLDIYLNGKGTWKGRNLIACLNVLSGEYDPLLAWPCRLLAEVVIRDQCSNLVEAQDYMKTIFVRKEERRLHPEQPICYMASSCSVDQKSDAYWSIMLCLSRSVSLHVF
ncbi:GL22390, partial [Drosophila persimilis]